MRTMSDTYKPAHGGYPATPANPLLSVMPAVLWNTIEQAARSVDERRAEFYRSKAGYGLTSR